MTRYIDLVDRITAELKSGPATPHMLMAALGVKRWSVDRCLHAMKARRIVTCYGDRSRGGGNRLLWWALAPERPPAQTANRITIGRGYRWNSNAAFV